MQVTINGELQTCLPQSLGELLASMDLDAASVVLELNGQIISPQAYASTRLEDGDRLEIVQFVGGG